VTVRGRGLVLVADDDEDILRFVEMNLRLEGFEVALATDGEQALRTAAERLPDLVVLDVMMPNLDGFEVCQRLRGDARTKHISVIMLTARALSADRVVGLTAGADDYIIKPFDPVELVARVHSTLRRVRETRARDPLTQLPGKVEVEQEIKRRIEQRNGFALLRVDLDGFKAFNDRYGFERGDAAIRALGACLREAIASGGGDGLVGHLGGDDFVVAVDPDRAEAAAKELIACWDGSVTALYDPEDRARGYVETVDRRKQIRRYPPMTVSVGIATTERRDIDSHQRASEIATEMNRFAKRRPSSNYAVDRRRGDGPEGAPRGASSSPILDRDRA
jgi:diguanylate cyclase (GGDEF)-like protein